jgi:hypothetical protein
MLEQVRLQKCNAHQHSLRCNLRTNYGILANEDNFRTVESVVQRWLRHLSREVAIIDV